VSKMKATAQPALESITTLRGNNDEGDHKFAELRRVSKKPSRSLLGWLIGP
jgi:hypothetical protein